MAEKILNLISRIGANQGLTAAQIKAMQATAKVESGFRPDAIGDNGTSYGLFQHHVGGAGGKTHDEARKYLDPVTSITERARWFKKNNITSGAQAAALQRPFDPRGYAVKVDNALKGLPTDLNAPVASAAGSGQAQPDGSPAATLGTPSFAQEYLKSYLGYDKDPVKSLLFDRFYGEAQSTKPEDDSSGSSRKTGTNQGGSAIDGPRHKGRLSSYEDIVALGKRWGLNIQGDFQTTGGKHSAGSKHYQSKAVDFGDATNDPERMKQFARYLARNAGSLGISDIWYTPMGWSVDNGKRTKATIGGHSDHLHVDLK